MNKMNEVNKTSKSGKTIKTTKTTKTNESRTSKSRKIKRVSDKQIHELEQFTGTIHHIESFGTVDGPGLRYVVFLQGCPLRCIYCHNPDAMPRAGGTVRSAGELVREILRYKSFIQNGGVTFSGGEPLWQPEFVKATSILLQQHGLHVAVDTAGCLPLAKTQGTIDQVDLILLDIKSSESRLSVIMTGLDNENTFDTLDYCEQIGKPVWIRHVLLRGYTLEHKLLHAVAKQLQGYKCIERVELLPFHKLGEPKWGMTRRKYILSDTPATTQQEVEEAREIFRAYGFVV